MDEAAVLSGQCWISLGLFSDNDTTTSQPVQLSATAIPAAQPQSQMPTASLLTRVLQSTAFPPGRGDATATMPISQYTCKEGYWSLIKKDAKQFDLFQQAI